MNIIENLSNFDIILSIFLDEKFKGQYLLNQGQFSYPFNKRLKVPMYENSKKQESPIIDDEPQQMQYEQEDLPHM